MTYTFAFETFFEIGLVLLIAYGYKNEEKLIAFEQELLAFTKSLIGKYILKRQGRVKARSRNDRLQSRTLRAGAQGCAGLEASGSSARTLSGAAAPARSSYAASASHYSGAAASARPSSGAAATARSSYAASASHSSGVAASPRPSSGAVAPARSSYAASGSEVGHGAGHGSRSESRLRSCIGKGRAA